MNRTRYPFYLFIASLIINIFVIALLILNSKEIADNKNFSQLQVKYPLLSKRVLLEFPQDVLVNFLDLRNKLRSQVAPYNDSFSFYFEYLPTGTSIGVNEKNEFHAASLFKVPVVMAYYHYKDRVDLEEDPILTITNDQLDSQFGDLWKKGAGAQIRASEAVKLTLQDSDNTAAKMLVPIIDKLDFENVYEGLDIELQSENGSAILTTKNYTSILKALYFSAVINKDSSEEILDILTKTKFPDKLAAGVPPNILVAHKIGDYNDDKGNEAFMDCGIVYLPRRPYSLCMISISDENVARERMQLLSKTIFDYISTR